jgi:hypothetical protein
MKTILYQLFILGIWFMATASPAFCGKIVESNFPAEPLDAVTVESDFGNVIVEGTPRDEVGVRLLLEPETQDRVELECELEGNNLIIRAEGRKNFRLRQYRGDKAQITVSVPDGLELDLKAEWGDIEIRGVSGRVISKTSRGSISVTSFAGSLEADARKGGINLSEIDGTVKAKTKGGLIRVEGYKGEVSARTFAKGVTICAVDNPENSCELHTNGGEIAIFRPRAFSFQPETGVLEENTENNIPQKIVFTWDGNISVESSD